MCRLNIREQDSLRKRMGSSNHVPEYSGPHRLIKFTNPEGTQMIAKSIFAAKSFRRVNKADAILIPKTTPEENLKALKIDIMCDIGNG